MTQYALEIRKSDLPLLTILNGGVTPEIEKTPTVLIIDTDGPNEIVTMREFRNTRLLSSRSPFLMKLNKK